MKRNHVTIIAEAGVNHNGDIDKAFALIEAAAAAGADYVKFQSFTAEKLVSPAAKKADYQSRNITGDSDEYQFSMLKKLELSTGDHERLIAHCHHNGIRFLSTAFDTDGLKYLDSLQLDLIKIPSGEITNYPYLKLAGGLGKRVVLSTGMATLDEITEAVRILTQNGLSKQALTVLHCNTEYPTPMEDVNLKAMHTIAASLGVDVGYSDHTMGIEVPIAAVALGATVIEKHFTLDRNLPGPDHKASLEPSELASMVRSIRNIELAISGNGEKLPSKSERPNISIARKSIHLSKTLPAGHVLTEEDLLPLRPGGGISPMKWNEIIGRKLNASLPAFHLLCWDNLS